MPFAVLKSIREVSSEDKLHCASNLLQNDAAKKWKTGDLGEKSAYVIIEMETAYSIKGIDIGNEYSAFVEVLVGGPGCTRENFKEILITCSFMTPVESKNSSNSNRVRCFNRDALVKETADEKWKLLKIVCTQPFNKHVKYGLSFIKIHVDEALDTKKKAVGTCSVNTSGAFTLREESPDSESESKTALFNRWKLSRNKDANGTTSSVPRIPIPALVKKTINSSSPASVNNSSPNQGLTIKKTLNTSSASVEKVDTKENKVADRNRDSLLFTDDDDESNMHDKRRKRLEKLEKVISADQERVTKANSDTKKPKKYVLVKNDVKSSDNKRNHHEDKTDDEPVPKKVLSKTVTTTSVSKPSTPSTSGQRRPSSSPCVSEKPKKPRLDKPVEYRPFNQLLRGVVLVISGIQNPDRANLRTKALALGAKYKPDWDSSSTHLICAFKNTPKYTQVRGVGKIITRSWIEDCHSQKKRLPWRRYALDSAELSKPESDEEIFDESLRPDEDRGSSNSRQSSEEAEKTNKPSKLQTNSEEDDDDIVELYDNNDVCHSQVISSGSDTEDEIQKVIASTSPKKKPTVKRSQTENVFEVSTEEEDYVAKRANNLPKALDFFKNLKFFISDQLSAVERIKVERYIKTFHGALTKSIEMANYVIANKPINAGEEFKGETVTPLWILECNDSESCIPTKRYLVT